MSRLELWHALLLVFPLLILLHQYVSPYTKVEESFNIQAAHDILAYGVPTSNVAFKFRANYDHMTFPGAVPRTFIGALVLAGVVRPLVWLNGAVDQQFLVRAALGLFNALALTSYALGVRRAYGKGAAVWYVFLQASQFHVSYYASRTLPNMFAFGLSTIAQRCLLPEPTASTSARIRRTRLALYLLTLATVIFRSELAILIASQCMYMLLRSPSNSARLSLLKGVIVPAGLFGSLVALALTVPIDTFFWQSSTPLWPELSAFLSNIFPSADSLGASEWGTSPMHWYFTSVLPRLLLNPFVLFLTPQALTNDVLRGKIVELVAPSITYVALYSFLGHKETRFLFPVIPPLTAAAAVSASYLYSRRSRSVISLVLVMILIVSTLLTSILSHAILLPLSALGYPGAHALHALDVHAHSDSTSSKHHFSVHLDNLATQTGVTRFLQRPASAQSVWTYDKTENATDLLTPLFWDDFDYAVMEEPGLAIGAWDVVQSIPALGTPQYMRPDDSRGLRCGRILETWRCESEGDANRLQTEVVGQLFGRVGWEISSLLHDILREGLGVQGVLGEGWSWTRGYWIAWKMDDRLFVLSKGQGAAHVVGGAEAAM